MDARILMCGAAIVLAATAGCASTGHAKTELAFSTAAPASYAEPLPIVEGHHRAITVGERTLWQSDADGPIDAVRVVRAPDGQGFAVIFRQADAIWLGVLDASAEPIAGLRRLNGRGRWVGPPQARVDGSKLHVAWSDGESVAEVRLGLR